jgi:hypothetical protein
MTRPFYRDRELSLTAGTITGSSSGYHFALFGKEATQFFSILKINV